MKKIVIIQAFIILLFLGYILIDKNFIIVNEDKFNSLVPSTNIKDDINYK